MVPGALRLADCRAGDTENDEKEFFDAYGEGTLRRYKLNKPMDLNARPRVYETNEGLASIELRGKDVVMIEGAQTREQLSRVSELVWKSKKEVAIRSK